MKIICLIDSLSSGGAQRQMVELAKGISEKGHDVQLLIYHNIMFHKPILDKTNVKVILIEEPNSLKRIFKMRKFIQAANPDLIISFLQTPNLITILSSFPFKKWKLIVGERSADPKILKSFRRKLYRYLYVYADCIIANSNANIQIVKKINPFISSSKLKVSYNLIDEGIWKADENYIPFKNNKLHLTIAASHRYLKNSKGLVEAINLLEDKEKDKLFVTWYGRKDEDNSYLEVKSLVNNYKLNQTIKFCDASSDIPNIFANSDVIGLFSFHEGLPNTICEAMTLGKAVIASNVSDIPILLGEDKNLLFDPQNNQDIARSLSYIISLSASELIEIGNQNKKRANELFDRNKIIDTYLNC